MAVLSCSDLLVTVHNVSTDIYVQGFFCGYKFLFLLGRYLGVELLDQMVTLWHHSETLPHVFQASAHSTLLVGQRALFPDH